MKITISLLITAACVLVACSNAPKLNTQAMPRSGFLPNYNILEPIYITDKDARVWRYNKDGVNFKSYTAVILDPIYLNQNATKEIGNDVINQTKAALQQSMVEAVTNKGNIKIARISVGITGGELSADSLKPWNFTPVGLAVNAAAFAGGVNAKTPALVVESKITDSNTNEIIGEGLITIQGESFRTASGSVDSFIAMTKRVVRLALQTSAR